MELNITTLKIFKFPFHSFVCLVHVQLFQINLYHENWFVEEKARKFNRFQLKANNNFVVIYIAKFSCKK